MLLMHLCGLSVALLMRTTCVRRCSAHAESAIIINRRWMQHLPSRIKLGVSNSWGSLVICQFGRRVRWEGRIQTDAVQGVVAFACKIESQMLGSYTELHRKAYVTSFSSLQSRAAGCTYRNHTSCRAEQGQLGAALGVVQQPSLQV